MNSFRALCAASLLALGLACEPAQAGLVLDLTPGGGPAVCGGCGDVSGTTYGWGFSVKSPITVNGIGLWDANSDGFGGQQYQAGLWTGAGALLAGATISDASTPVASAAADGRWMFESIAPVKLGAGDYLIGSVFHNSDPIAEILGPFITDPRISLTGGAQGPGPDGGFSAPTAGFGIPIFGPTLRTPTSVPEPETAPLLLVGLFSAGLLSFGGRRRKR